MSSIALEGDARSTARLASEAQAMAARRRRAITSAWAGFALDSYSIYLPNTALLPRWAISRPTSVRPSPRCSSA